MRLLAFKKDEKIWVNVLEIKGYDVGDKTILYATYETVDGQMGKSPTSNFLVLEDKRLN